MSPEEVTSIDKRIKELLEIMQSSWESRQEFLHRKQKKLESRIEQVQQMARACGASEQTDLWPYVMDIACSKSATKFFMASDPAGRLKLVKHYAEFEDFGGSQPRGIRRKPLLKVCSWPFSRCDPFQTSKFLPGQINAVLTELLPLKHFHWPLGPSIHAMK